MGRHCGDRLSEARFCFLSRPQVPRTEVAHKRATSVLGTWGYSRMSLRDGDATARNCSRSPTPQAKRVGTPIRWSLRSRLRLPTTPGPPEHAVCVLGWNGCPPACGIVAPSSCREMGRNHSMLVKTGLPALSWPAQTTGAGGGMEWCGATTAWWRAAFAGYPRRFRRRVIAFTYARVSE